MHGIMLIDFTKLALYGAEKNSGSEVLSKQLYKHDLLSNQSQL